MRISLPCIDKLCKRSLVTSVCDQKLRKMPGLLRRIYYVTWGAKTQTRGRTFSLWTLMLMLRGGGVESAVRHGSARSLFPTLRRARGGTRTRRGTRSHCTGVSRVRKEKKILQSVAHLPGTRCLLTPKLENLPVMTLACWSLATLGQASRRSC